VIGLGAKGSRHAGGTAQDRLPSTGPRVRPGPPRSGFLVQEWSDDQQGDQEEESVDVP